MKFLGHRDLTTETAGEGRGLDVGEGQLGGTDTGRLAGCLQASQRDIRRQPAGQHEMSRARQRSRHLAKQRQPWRTRRDPVYVVKQKAHVKRRAPDQRVEDVPCAGPSSPWVITPAGEGVQERPRQPARVFMVGLAAHPRVDPARLEEVRPHRLSQRGRLAESWSRDNKSDRPRPAFPQAVNQPQPRQLDVKRLWHSR